MAVRRREMQRGLGLVRGRVDVRVAVLKEEDEMTG
jgi:hypothetical protein